MWGKTNVVAHKSPDYQKLVQYGFVRHNDTYVFKTKIMAGDFALVVSVIGKETTLTVIDCATEEEYALVCADGAVGEFVTAVRSACEDVLTDIVRTCYRADVFQSSQAALVIDYVRRKYGTEVEYLWEKFPNHAVFREQKKLRWFGTLSRIEKRKIGIHEAGMIELLGLKEIPSNIEQIVDGAGFLPGYHMNKKYWYCIRLDSSVSVEEIYRRVDVSFDLLLKK